MGDLWIEEGGLQNLVPELLDSHKHHHSLESISCSFQLGRVDGNRVQDFRFTLGITDFV